MLNPAGENKLLGLAQKIRKLLTKKQNTLTPNAFKYTSETALNFDKLDPVDAYEWRDQK